MDPHSPHRSSFDVPASTASEDPEAQAAPVEQPAIITAPSKAKSRKAKPGAPPTPHAAVGANNHHHGLGRDSMASTWAGSQDGSLAGGGGHRPGSRSDTTLGGGAGWDGGRGLARQSSVARQPLASGEWVSRKRDWGGGRAGSGVHQTGWFGRGGRAPTVDDSASGGPPLPPHIILPNERGYLYWFLLTLLAALWTGIIDPYVVAFSASPGLYPYTDAQAWISYAITAVFCADVAVRFRLAYVDEATGDLVTRGPAIARHYARGMLAVDLLAAIPLDWVVLAFVSPTGQDSPAARYLTLLGLLRLLRLYRVRLALIAAEANLAISLLGSTIVRNLAFVFYLAHWAACGFYFCARMAGFSPATWVGRGVGGLVGASTSDRYLASLYWAVTVFTTTGFGDLVAVSRAETVWTILYMLSALVLGTYIVGTTTLLLIKGDEAKGRYRDQASALKAYSHLNGLPPPLELAMYEHLRLAHANADIADEVVLGSLPATLRRRALRHLYAAPLKTCYLFSGGRQRFLDALLSASEVELLMAGVDVISDGDHVPDLMVCVSGTLELTLPGLAEGGEDLPLMGAGAGARSASAASGPDPNKSVRLGVRRHLGAGDPVGEVSFFTDVPHCGTARTASVARLLVIPRVAWDRISADFPLGTRTVLDNLRGRAQEMVDGEFRGAAGRALLAAAPPGIAHAQASAEAGRGVGGGRGVGAGAGRGAAAAAATAAASGGTSMSALQERVLSDLLRVQALAATVLAKSDERRTQAFLGAASRGDLTTVRVMLQQRFEVDSVDYDGRCALSLAAAKNHVDIVELLLASQANPNLVDNLNSSPLMEASKAGSDRAIRALVQGGATWHMSTIDTAAALCTTVFEANLPLLRRYLAAGARADAGDYDARTALHIAACENALPAVKLLVEGGADIDAVDRFGSQPLDEAVRVGATAVAAFLTDLGAGTAKAEERTAQFLNACSVGDTDLIRFMLANGQPPGSADYDARSGLMLAVGGGHFSAVTTLLGAGAPADAADAFGGSALTEAIKLRRRDMVDLLVSAGARLAWPTERAAGTLCQAAAEGDAALIAMYAAAGLAVNAGDYDSRRASHIAAADGSVGALTALLGAGADINATDRWGATAMLEAVKAVAAGKAEAGLIDTVAAAGGRLGMAENELSGVLCSAVHAGDGALLALYLRAGADPSAADYDRRTPLHIAAAEGALEAVKALVAAGADTRAADRWGHSPLDEARREKRGPVVDFLTTQAGGSGRR